MIAVFLSGTAHDSSIRVHGWSSIAASASCLAASCHRSPASPARTRSRTSRQAAIGQSSLRPPAFLVRHFRVPAPFPAPESVVSIHRCLVMVAFHHRHSPTLTLLLIVFFHHRYSLLKWCSSNRVSWFSFTTRTLCPWFPSSTAAPPRRCSGTIARCNCTWFSFTTWTAHSLP